MRAILFCIFLFVTHCITASDIAVVSIAAGENYQQKVKLGIENNRYYCQQHGYDFIFSDQSEDTSRHIYWSKIALVLKTLQKPTYKWVVWIDADALIMNHGIPLEDLIDEKYNFIISRDSSGINSGVFFIKNCDWSRDFLKSVYARTDCLKNANPEQDAIKLQIQLPAYKAFTKIVPQRFFNSYEGNYYHRHTNIAYQPGDFIVHFAGLNLTLGFSLSDLCQKYASQVVNDRKLLTLDSYLSIYGYQPKPDGSGQNEGFMTDAQKQQFCARLALMPEITTIAEIGLNAGHSANTFFHSCPNLTKLVSFDINHHKYTAIAAEYLARTYKNCFEFVAGDSILTILHYAKQFPSQKFDLIYIDGNHTFEYCYRDILNCKSIAHSGTIVWVDDYNFNTVSRAVQKLLHDGQIEINEIHRSFDPRGERCWVELQYRH